jgi:Zn-dependent M16 (insulinase) family peptidase
LTKSIIGAIGVMDTYQLPDAKGYTSMQRFLSGETDEYRQRLRDQVLSTTLEDFKRFGDYLVKVKENGVVAVLGSSEAISSAAASNPEWLKVLKVL